MGKPINVTIIEKQTGRMLELLREKKYAHAVIRYDAYDAESYPRDGFLRTRRQRGNTNLRIVNDALPVRYDNDWNVTHVMCWVPQHQHARWVNLSTWHFEKKDTEGIPERLLTD